MAGVLQSVQIAGSNLCSTTTQASHNGALLKVSHASWSFMWHANPLLPVFLRDQLVDNGKKLHIGNAMLSLVL